MLIPICNCDRNFSFIPLKPIPRAPYQFPVLCFPNSTHTQYRRRARIITAAVEAKSQSLSHYAIRRIAEKLRNLGFAEESSDDTSNDTLIAGPNSPGEIFVPLRSHLPKQRVGHTLDQSWSTPENPVPEPGTGNAIQRFHELRRGVQEEEDRSRRLNKRNSKITPSMADITLSKEELHRLRSVGIHLKKKLKVGKAGITEGIVNGIHERWRTSELVKITCEDICRLNMKRTHELLEKKTGGLVIWRSGSNIILYRGPNYKYPYFFADNLSKGSSSSEIEEDSAIRNEMCLSSSVLSAEESHISHPPLVHGVGLPNRVRFQLPGEAELAEDSNALLEGLGPRFNDWWGNDPLPVDADLLPAVVPGHKRPFRLLPYGVKPKLTNDELNTLRRLARPLPCHFAVGRNKKLQGLAAAIVKLWEKCEIAKIAVKRGAQNTNSVMMSEELKSLTGGTLLSRDKEFIVFYRGKDFLPAAVSSAIDERRKYGMDMFQTRIASLQDEYKFIAEGKEYDSKSEDNKESKLDLDGSYDKQTRSLSQKAIERTNIKLSAALAKKVKAEKLLGELERKVNHQEPETDKEGITKDERYMLRRVGLRMKPFLLMGRRGIFDGTIENMHLHWKYRELVKVCIGPRNIEEVHRIAQMLEAESGGILVAVEPSSNGHYIIVYRGKNYKRPASLRPETLMSKREALKHSIEAQRHQSLKLHVLKLNKTIDELKQKAMIEGENDEESSSSDTENDVESWVDVSPDELKDREIHLQTNFLSDTTGTEQSEITQGSSEAWQRKTVKPSRYEKRRSLTTTGYTRSPYRVTDNFNKPSTQNNVNCGLSLPASNSSSLSNNERLLLRKLALGMKKRPVLAIGKGNVISGVAKAIKEHLRNHPLAIVSIKDRAKGTSIQEVIYNLEQATGAVFVSQEPSKVILYRGWGATVKKDMKSDSTKPTPALSQELIRAIRLECGLESNYVEDDHWDNGGSNRR